MSNVNLDHISASHLLPEVQEAMIDVIRDFPGNPSSQNIAGERAAEIMEKPRQSVAGLINCDPREVVFVSGGTESINMAVKGVARGAALVGTPTAGRRRKGELVPAPCAARSKRNRRGSIPGSR